GQLKIWKAETFYPVRFHLGLCGAGASATGEQSCRSCLHFAAEERHPLLLEGCSLVTANLNSYLHFAALGQHLRLAGDRYQATRELYIVADTKTSPLREYFGFAAVPTGSMQPKN